MPGEVRLWKSLILSLYVVQLARRHSDGTREQAPMMNPAA